MRSSFREFYRPSEDEFNSLWKDGLIVLDTNVLFSLYRYSDATRKSMFSTLELFKDRLWLPYWVAFEYHQNRIEVITQLHDVYSELESTVDSFKQSVDKVLQAHTRHPTIEAKSTNEAVKTSTDQIIAYIEERREKHPNHPNDQAPGADDPIRDALTEIFEGKVGKPFSSTEFDDICREGAKRYEKQIPPGFKDANSKTGDRIYGDLIIWKEILRQAKEISKPIVFVTDDLKEDWWLRHKGKTIGPRPELVKEIFDESGVLFHMYKPVQFIERARQRIENSKFITDDMVSEVKEVSDSESAYINKLHEYRNRLVEVLSDTERKRDASELRLRRLEARYSQDARLRDEQRTKWNGELINSLRLELEDITSERHQIELDTSIPQTVKTARLFDLGNKARRLEQQIEISEHERWQQRLETDRHHDRQQIQMRTASKQLEKYNMEIDELRNQIAELDVIIIESD